MVITAHGLVNRLFLMRWLHWTPETFARTINPRNCEMLVLRLQPPDAAGRQYYALDAASVRSLGLGDADRTPRGTPGASPRFGPVRSHGKKLNELGQESDGNGTAGAWGPTPRGKFGEDNREVPPRRKSAPAPHLHARLLAAGVSASSGSGGDGDGWSSGGDEECVCDGPDGAHDEGKKEK